MPLINLIQERRLEAQARENKVRALLIATVGLGATAFLTAAYFGFEAARHQLMIVGLEQQKKRLTPMLNKYEQNLAEAKELEPRIKSLQDAAKATERWSSILRHLTTSMPEGVWLTELRSNSSDASKGVSVNFTGLSLNQAAIGQAVIRMQTSPDLAGVTFKESSSRIIQERQLYEFEATGTVTGTEVKESIRSKSSSKVEKEKA